MKKIKLKEKFRKWFYNDVLNSYLIEFHPRFLLVASNVKIKRKDFDNKSEKEYKRIMKVLNSQKFKRHFYRVVDYSLTEKSVPEPKNNFWSKLKKFVAKQYLRFFNKELYKSLLRFKRLSEGYDELNAAANDYIQNTTLNERGERAVDVGISSKGNSEAHKRMRNISDIRVAAIHEKNIV